jgi:hypothetical protein
VKQFEDDAVRKSEGDSVFTLAAFHPCPEELTTDGGWYDWNINNWGTKWDVDCTESDGSQYYTGRGAGAEWLVGYSFDSAWAPPLTAIEKISAIYTRLTFTLIYAEPGNGYEGRAKFEDGIQTEDLNQEYTGDLLEREYF